MGFVGIDLDIDDDPSIMYPLDTPNRERLIYIATTILYRIEMSSNVIIDDDLIDEIINHIPSMSTKNRPIVIRSNRGSYTGIGYEDDVLDRIRDLCIYISEGSDVSMGYTVPRVIRR